MCRNIRTLFNFAPPATEDEIHAAAVQFVRKLSGFSKPSQANQAAFDQAVAEVAAGAPAGGGSGGHAAGRGGGGGGAGEGAGRGQEVEAEKAKERSKKRFARP